MKKLMICLSASILLILSACSISNDQDQAVSPVKMDNNINAAAPIVVEHEILKKESREFQKRTSQDNENLRNTLNLSFKIFAAMEATNYDYLQSVSSKNVTINRESNTIDFIYGDKPNSTTIPKNINLQTLEFRGLTISNENEVELAFANADIKNEFMVEIYMKFKMEDGSWKLDGYVTN
ncbi:hypothetical protein [Paenibacillus marinisediminis]